MTKQQLNEYRYLIQNIQLLKEQLLDLDTRLKKTTKALSHMPRCKPPMDLHNELLAKKVDLEMLLDRKILTAMIAVEMIEGAIEKLPEREKLLMRLRYIKGLSWEQVCEVMSYSKNVVHAIHREALFRVG